MSEIKHSPLPWHVTTPNNSDAHSGIAFSGKNGYEEWKIADLQNDCPCPQAENAAFITRAVNSHYELVGALEALLEFPNTGPATHAARAALAKARGEQ